MYRLMYYNEFTQPIPSLANLGSNTHGSSSASIPKVIPPETSSNSSTELSPTSTSAIHLLTIEQVERLTLHQREILKKTFAPMDAHAVPNGLKMLIKLFSEYPRYKLIWPQFRAIPDSSLMNAIELRRHASVYMTGLGSIIHSMDDTAKLEKQLTRIARAHIKWNIHRSHISHMLQPVLEIVADCNGNINEEIREAWSTLYSLIADLIEIYRAQERRQHY